MSYRTSRTSRTSRTRAVAMPYRTRRYPIGRARCLCGSYGSRQGSPLPSHRSSRDSGDDLWADRPLDLDPARASHIPVSQPVRHPSGVAGSITISDPWVVGARCLIGRVGQVGRVGRRDDLSDGVRCLIGRVGRGGRIGRARCLIGRVGGVGRTRWRCPIGRGGRIGRARCYLLFPL